MTYGNMTESRNGKEYRGAYLMRRIKRIIPKT